MDDREEMEDLEEDDVDYPIDLDVDLFDFHKKELKQIVSVLAISDTARDKFSFTVFSWNVAFTGFLAGYLPNYFYIWHTLKFVLLIIHRWYTYKKMQYHYFLFDFCYFTNLLILTYLWLPAFLPTALRGHLFIFVFAYAHGPLLSAIVLWRNSLVPHSVDKMTSLHIHISPAVALWGIRWHSTPEQGFPLCASPSQPAVGEGESMDQSCSDVDLWQTVLLPLVLYLFWQLLYVVYVEVYRKKRVEERKYETSYKWIAERAKKGSLYQLFRLMGPKYMKHMYIVWQLIYTAITILPTNLFYH